MPAWTAIVLTGGGSTRLGRDKATVHVAGARMIDRVLAQIPAEVPVVVVGPDPQVSREVVVTREDPPGGGPAAGIAAGLEFVRTDLVAVIAADMPFGARVVAGLVDRLADSDAVAPISQGHTQALAAVYRTSALRRAGLSAGMSMKQVLAGLRVAAVPMAPEELVDVDTPADLAAVRGRLTIMDADTKERSMDEWVAAVKRELGIEADVDVALILDVAKDVAHGVQRPATPVTTYLLGLAVAAGADPQAAAARVSALAGSWRPAEPDA